MTTWLARKSWTSVCSPVTTKTSSVTVSQTGVLAYSGLCRWFPPVRRGRTVVSSSFSHEENKRKLKKNTLASWTNISSQGPATWVKGLCEEWTLSSVAGEGAGSEGAWLRKTHQTARRLIGQHSGRVGTELRLHPPRAVFWPNATVLRLGSHEGVTKQLLSSRVAAGAAPPPRLPPCAAARAVNNSNQRRKKDKKTKWTKISIF